MKLAKQWAVLSAGLAISAAIYLFDCFVAIYITQAHPELRWFERGVYTGRLFVLTLGLVLGAMIYPVYLRTRFSIRRAHGRGSGRKHKGNPGETRGATKSKEER
jgi:hypothetical protein